MEWSTNNSTSYYKRFDLDEVLQNPRVTLIFAFLIVLDLLTLVGNGMVILTVFKARRLHFSAFYFVANLGFADFLVGLLVLPISLAYHLTFEMEGRWVFGSVPCKIWLLANFWFCSCSVLSLCLISWDRYVAVTSPLSYKMSMSKTKCKRLIALIWTFSFSESIIIITKVRLIDGGTRINCTIHSMDDPVFTVFSVAILFLIPTIFLIFVNTKVWFVARLHKKKIRTLWDNSIRLGTLSNNDVTNLRRGTSPSLYDVSNSVQENRRRSSFDDISMSRRTTTSLGMDNVALSTQEINLCDLATTSTGTGSSVHRSKWSLTRTIKQEIRTFRTFLIVIGALIISWCPFFTFLVLDNFLTLDPFVFYLTIVLGYVNSAMNVFIYGLFSTDFRRAMINIFCRCTR